MTSLKLKLLFVALFTLGFLNNTYGCTTVVVHNLTELNMALALTSITEITLAAPSQYIITSSIDFGSRVIIGDDPTAVLITCTANLDTGVFINGGTLTGVTVQNCTVRGIAATNATVNNCIVKNNGIQGITVDSGSFISNSQIVYNGNTGGGVHVNSGLLTIQSSNISYNTGSNGGGVFSSGTVSISSCTVSHNTASGSGGGIYISGGSSSTIATSLITRNTAGSDGGGIYTSYYLVLTDSTVSNNNAINNCGGISCRDQLIRNVSFLANSAGSTGGGGCVYSGTSDIRNSTFDHNTAVYGYGGLYTEAVSIANSIFSYNSELSNGQGGGGLRVWNAYLNNVQFAYNSVNSNGGGITGGRFVTIIGCSFVGNVAFFGGGLYFNQAPSVIMDQSTFITNTANQGGGIYTDDTAFIISNSYFSNNVAAGGDGGGASLRMNPFGSVRNTTFISNTAGRNGGGLRTTGNATITYCTFTSNTAVRFGGGNHHSKDNWYAYPNNYAVINNCIYGSNGYGGGMIVEDAPGSITNNIYV